MGLLDGIRRIVNGAVAHHSVDAGGAPVKVGGRYNNTWGGSEIDQNDIGDLRVDKYQRVLVQITGSALGDNSTSIPNVAASVTQSGFSLILTPSVPVPAGSDILNAAGAAITAADLTITDTAEHWFFIPMASYRSVIFYLENSGTAWNQDPTITISGAFGVGTTYVGATLEQFTRARNGGRRCCIGTNPVGGLAGISGDATETAGNAYYPVPAMSDGWPYVALKIKFSVAPTAGGISRLGISRQRF